MKTDIRKKSINPWRQIKRKEKKYFNSFVFPPVCTNSISFQENKKKYKLCKNFIAFKDFCKKKRKEKKETDEHDNK